MAGLLTPGATPPVKRKAYFSFHYEDIMRVNNVRNAWKIDHPDSAQNRSFFDSSLWESKKAEGDDAVKNLIRDGVGYTSTVCVLVGTHTWGRRWVRYEIARSIIDGKGLVGVHINGLNHHQRQTPDPLGSNPMNFMGIARKENQKLYLCEKNGENWTWYADYTNAIDLPKYLSPPQAGYIRILSEGAAIHDYVIGSGHSNIGSWIDQAAQKAGR